MPISSSFTYTEPFFPNESVSGLKMWTQISAKINILISDQQSVNTYLNTILQGASAGADQAKTVFFMSAAPDGWIRDISIESDCLLRSCDTSTVPPGSSPSAVGGVSGGSWTVSGIDMASSTTHTHVCSHRHDFHSGHTVPSHTHTMGNHDHTYIHTHAISARSSTVTVNSGENWGVIYNASVPDGVLDFLSSSHTHSLASHDHGGVTSSSGTTMGNISTNNTGTSYRTESVGGNPVDPSSSLTLENGSYTGGSTGSTSVTTLPEESPHTHTVTSDGTWRPLYSTVIVCEKN